MGSEWIEVKHLQEGDTIRFSDGEMLEDITQEQIQNLIEQDHQEVELLY